MFITLPHKTIELDEQGYLINLQEWDKEVANALALLQEEKIQLTNEHWSVLNYLRNFYQEFPTIKAPTMRVMVKELNKLLDSEKANSAYFYRLFPKGLVQAIKIAGLPKDTRCKEDRF